MRSLADAIRAMDEHQLVTLMRERPDLAQPRPSSLSDLVERASSPSSTAQAMERLDCWLRRVAEGLAAAHEPVSPRHLAAMLDADRGAVEAALRVLERRALVWGTGKSLQLTRAAAAAFGPFPAGLAAPSPLPLTDADVTAALTALTPEQRALLDPLVWHPRGRLRTPVRGAPAEALLNARILRRHDEESVVLAREVALHLRGGRFFADAVPSQPPGFPPAAEPGRLLEQAALGTAVEALSLVTDLVEQLISLAPRVLSTGGLGRRDLKLLAGERPVAEVEFAFRLALQAGLVAAHGPTWLATPQFDRWDALAGWGQWRALARAWTRGAERIGRAVMAELHQAPTGTPIDTHLLAARVLWRYPTWPEEAVQEATTAVVRDAEVLGVVALGRVSELAHTAEDPGFPAAGHQFVLQSDLTAVLPGPLQTDVRRRLDLVTAREGSTRRFTAASVRRGLDSGLTAQSLLQWLEDHSLTPVPQPLAYLVADVARLHGQLRVMPAASVVTVEDPAILESLLRSPEAKILGFRRVGPQAIAAQGDVEEVVDLLRSMGQAPVPTNESGEPLQAPVPRRATRATAPHREPEPPTRDQLTLLARALLTQTQPDEEDDVVDLLGRALESGEWTELTHVDARGVATTDVVRVLGVQGGQARVVRRASAPTTVPVARVVQARIIGACSPM